MPDIERIQPDGLVDVRPFGFTQVVTATGGKHVFISGQVSVDEQGTPVGIGDLVAQTHQVMKNLSAALASVSASFDNVVKLTVFIVNYQPAVRGEVLAVRNQYVSLDHSPASTLIGVQALASEEFLIEIEAVAVVE